jgi:hypothetical protein
VSATVFFTSTAELATLTNTFKVAGTPTDPTTITLTVTDPTGAANVYTYAAAQVTRTGTGVYTKDVACSIAGTWTYQWDGTSAAADTIAGTWEVYETQIGKLYCTVEALKSRLNITNSNSDLEVHSACFAVSRWVEQFCGRIFYRTASEVRTFVAADLLRLDLPRFNDIVSASALATDSAGDGTFETSWSSTEYQLWPANTSGPETQSHWAIRAIGTKSFPLGDRTAAARMDRVQVTGIFGWPAVPMGVKQGALVLAADAFKLKDAPFGVQGEGDFAVRIGENRRAQAFLTPYRRYPTWSA